MQLRMNQLQDGSTALMVAAQNSHTSVIKVLLDSTQCDLYIKDNVSLCKKKLRVLRPFKTKWDFVTVLARLLL